MKGKHMLAINTDEKVRENKLRRKAARMGLRLTKSRSRDPDALDYGLFALIDIQTNGAINPALAGHWVHSWGLVDVEKYLTSGDGK